MKRMLCVLAVVSSGLLLPTARVLALSPPQLIHYQGRLLDGTNLVNGTVGISFRIFNVASNGVPLYEDSNEVAVADGLYSTFIGDQTNFGSFAAALTNNDPNNPWLEIAVNGTALKPRERIVSVAYAINADLARTVVAGGITSVMLADGAVTSNKIAALAVKPGHVDDGGEAEFKAILANATVYSDACDANVELVSRLSDGGHPALQKNSVPLDFMFDALLPVVVTNGAPPPFMLSIGGSPIGTVMAWVDFEHTFVSGWCSVSVRLPDPTVDADAQIGRDARLTFQRNGLATYFHGIVRRFRLTGFDGSQATYSVEIVPRFWTLGVRSDLTLYQAMTTPQIVTQVLQKAGVTNYSMTGLTGTYLPREYCVQYRETDFNFVCRLMEEEGIWYYFKHDAGGHTMIFGDHNGAFQPLSSHDYHGDNALPAVFTEEYVRKFAKGAAAFTGRSSLRAYDFTKPTNLPFVTAFDAAGIGLRYEFEHVFVDSFSLALPALAPIYLEGFQTERRPVSGQGNGGGLRAGGVFHLNDTSGASMSGDYLVTGVRHAGFVRESGGTTNYLYGNQFTAIPSAQTYRPPRATPKPKVNGPSTAVVVGPGGEEIHVDQYGRVKVQFHWDREGKTNENSSAWLRVAQPSAGRGYGMMFIPRIGQEVIVDFLEGNPDAPVIMGRMYNEDQMPPYPLPANKHLSVISTRSTNGSVNEIKFDDTPGSEQIVITSRQVRVNTSALTVSGAGVFSSIAPQSLDSNEVTQVGEYTRRTAPIAYIVVSMPSPTQLVAQSSYNCTAQRTAPGFYRLTFTAPPASSNYAAIVTASPATPALRNVSVYGRTPAYFDFAIFDNFNPVDTPFTAIVFGGF